MADPVVHTDEADLAVAAKRGDQAAFATLYARYQRSVYGYFRARLLDSHAAEDLCQEVFFRVYGALGRFDPKLRFQSWVMGVARNVLREHVRHIRRRSEVGWTELCIELEEMVDDESLYDDVMHLIPVCLSSLSEHAGQALRWHYMGGMKVAKIAERLNRTVGAVKVLMVRARQAVKRCIASQMEGGSDS